MRRGPRPLARLRRHPYVADGLLAAFLTAFAIGGVWAKATRPENVHWRHPDAFALLIILCQTVPLLWRRRDPKRVLIITGVTTVVFYAVGYPPTAIGGAVIVAFYSVAVHDPDRRAWRPAALIFAGLVASLLVFRGRVGIAGFTAWNMVVFAAAWMIGDNIRNRRAYLAALEERAARLEREQEAEARQAVATERARIARELHDVVAHSMSVMVVQAGAARRVIERDQAQAIEALRSIEETGRQSLDEMRRLLGVLRAEEDSGLALAPQPTADDLGSLIARVREAGLDVAFTVEGEARPVPPGVDLSLYRLVQEALTNTLKHAGPAQAEVRLCWAPNDVEVEVLDDGRGPPIAGAGTGESGHGLIGMRERVALFAGELRAGRRPGGGYRVWARIPTGL